MITVSRRPWRAAIARASATFPATSAHTHLTISIRSGCRACSSFSAGAQLGSRAPAYTKAVACVSRMHVARLNPAYRAPNQLQRVEKRTCRGTIPILLLAPVTRYTVDEEVAIDVELGSKRGAWSVKLKSNDPHRRRTLASLYTRVQLASIVYIVLRSPVGTHTP